MKKRRFSDEQIIQILKEHEAVHTVDTLCRRHGIGNSTFYKWKSKFGGMDVSKAKRLRELESENAKLKRLLADTIKKLPANFNKEHFQMYKQYLENRHPDSNMNNPTESEYKTFLWAS